MIVSRNIEDSVYAAFPEKEQARAEMQEHKTFHKRDVLRPCTITYEI